MASCDDQIVPVKKRKFTWYSNFFEDVLAQLPENQVAMLSIGGPCFRKPLMA